jgi:hypothetical protein
MRQISTGLVGRLLTGQELLGVKDGVNTVFSTPRPFLRTPEYREALYVRGRRWLEGVGCDYVAVESGGPGTGYDTIVLAVAPDAEDNMLIDYYPAG